MSFFRYPGGKKKLRHFIIKSLKEKGDILNIQYREPFFGGGSIGVDLLQQNIAPKHIWINDKDIGIACLWTSLIKYTQDLKDRVKEFYPTVNDFYEFKLQLSNLSKMPRQRSKVVDIGFKKLALHQISYSGLGLKSGGPLGGADQKSKYKIDCRWSQSYICKKIDKLFNIFEKIDVYNNECTNFDFIDLIENNEFTSLIYLDPPYYVKGNELYHCGFTKEDHIRLSKALRSTSHQWVLSYDDCDEIRNLYSWANLEEIYVNYSITALKDNDTGERLATQKKELLISSEASDIVGRFSWI